MSLFNWTKLSISSLIFLSFLFFFYQSLVWFGWFSNDNSTVNSTNDFNGKKQTKLFFWNKIKNHKSLSLFVLWIDWWFFDDFSTNKKRVDLIWFFQPNQPFDTSFSQIKWNQLVVISNYQPRLMFLINLIGWLIDFSTQTDLKRNQTFVYSNNQIKSNQINSQSLLLLKSQFPLIVLIISIISHQLLLFGLFWKKIDQNSNEHQSINQKNTQIKIKDHFSNNFNTIQY